MALASVTTVEAIDAAPERVLMACHNAGVDGRVADVAELEPSADYVHFDPARRASGRRLWQYEDYVPGPDVIEPWLVRSRGAAVKLGPGLDWEQLPARGQEFEVLPGLPE